MQGNSRGTYGTRCKVTGMQENAGKCRRMPGEQSSGCKNARGMQGDAGECQVNVREWVQCAR